MHFLAKQVAPPKEWSQFEDLCRRAVILPQDDIPNHFPRELADDCDDPETFKQLAGFGNPYQSQTLPVPRARRETVALTAVRDIAVSP